MKNRFLIIEDDFYRYFTLRQVLKTALNLRFTIEVAEDQGEVVAVASTYKHGQVIFHQDGGILGLIDHFKKKKVNRLNSDIRLLVTRELEFQIKSQFRHHLTGSAPLPLASEEKGNLKHCRVLSKVRIKEKAGKSAGFSEAA